jgi:hypothetical protein
MGGRGRLSRQAASAKLPMAARLLRWLGGSSMICRCHKLWVPGHPLNQRAPHSVLIRIRYASEAE